LSSADVASSSSNTLHARAEGLRFVVQR